MTGLTLSHGKPAVQHLKLNLIEKQNDKFYA